MTPSARRKYVLVTDRNLSWPAVSHNCIAMLRSSTRMVFTWKSTPRVELRLDMNTPFVILLMKEVLPTAASPANTTLYVLSGGPVGSRSRSLPRPSSLSLEMFGILEKRVFNKQII